MREPKVKKSTSIQTQSGKIHVRWDDTLATTPMGQLAFFAEFLTMTGLWTQWQDTCPLRYRSPNAPSKADVLGTWLLSILAGHKRYAHVTCIRCDGVNPGFLGMNKVISEDALRRALAAISEDEGIAWLDQHIRQSVTPLLNNTPWILDIDTTIKPLYGKQEGAKISYNPKKPGRPSHSYHSYIVAGLRLILGVEVKAGTEHSGNHTLPGLLSILDEMTPAQRPKMVRGDCGFGSDTLMKPLEERGQGFLLKLRLSKNVKRHIVSLFNQPDWCDAGQGWEGKDGSLKLSGWEGPRRVVVMRRPIQNELLITQEEENGQMTLGFIEAEMQIKGKLAGYEYSVLVTNMDYEIRTLGQLYRDRADAENTFDELKNQWGWGGFTTQDMHRCQLSAKAVALIYNWWSLFARLANPEKRKEAITSRPWLMASIGRKTEHAGQTTLTLNGIHAHFKKGISLLLQASDRLKQWAKKAAEHLEEMAVWDYVCRHLRYTLTAIEAPVFCPVDANYYSTPEVQTIIFNS